LRTVLKLLWPSVALGHVVARLAKIIRGIAQRRVVIFAVAKDRAAFRWVVVVRMVFSCPWPAINLPVRKRYRGKTIATNWVCVGAI